MYVWVNPIFEVKQYRVKANRHLDVFAHLRELRRHHTHVRVYRLMIIFNEVDESRVQPDAIGSASRYSFLVIWTRFFVWV